MNFVWHVPDPPTPVADMFLAVMVSGVLTSVLVKLLANILQSVLLSLGHSFILTLV